MGLSSSTGGFERLTALCSLLLLLHGLGGDSVHVHDTLLGESLTHGDGGAFGRVEFGGSDEACFLKLHEAETDVLTSCSAGVLWLGSVSCSVTVVLAETVDTDLLAHVELVSDGGSTDIEPVVVVWGELLLASGLNVLGPLLSIILISTEIRHKAEIARLRGWVSDRLLTSGILILFPFLRCAANTSMNSLAGTSFTVFTCLLRRERCC